MSTAVDCGVDESRVIGSSGPSPPFEDDDGCCAVGGLDGESELDGRRRSCCHSVGGNRIFRYFAQLRELLLVPSVVEAGASQPMQSI